MTQSAGSQAGSGEIPSTVCTVSVTRVPGIEAEEMCTCKSILRKNVMTNKRNKCVWRKETGMVFLGSLELILYHSTCFPLLPVPRLSPLLSRQIGWRWGRVTNLLAIAMSVHV